MKVLPVDRELRGIRIVLEGLFIEGRSVGYGERLRSAFEFEEKKLRVPKEWEVDCGGGEECFGEMLCRKASGRLADRMAVMEWFREACTEPEQSVIWF